MKANDSLTTVDTLIFAGGIGRRMGLSDRPKQFLELSGRPIIDYTIEHFARHPDVSRITVVCLESWIDYLKNYLSTRHYTLPIDIVPGGKTGQESIFLGLNHIHSLGRTERDIVLVHDGVRPLIDAETISACIQSVANRGCTATVAPAIETVIVRNASQQVTNILDRSHCSLARAPQGFLTEQLYRAHLSAQADKRGDFVDSISLMAHYGYSIYTVEGPAENIKVTTPTDYYAFRAYMEARDQAHLLRSDQ